MEKMFSPASTGSSKVSRLGSLQAFQARITERIALAQSNTEVLDTYLSFKIGEVFVQLALQDIGMLVPLPELTRVPLVGTWLKGLAVVNAEVVSVLDLAYCLNTHLKGALHDKLSSHRETPWAFGASTFGANQRSTIDLGHPTHAQSPGQPSYIAPNSTSEKNLAKLILLNANRHKQLAVSADHVIGIVSQAQLATLTQHHEHRLPEHAENALEGVGGKVIEQLSFDQQGQVWLRLNLNELLKTPAFMAQIF